MKEKVTFVCTFQPISNSISTAGILLLLPLSIWDIRKHLHMFQWGSIDVSISTLCLFGSAQQDPKLLITLWGKGPNILLFFSEYNTYSYSNLRYKKKFVLVSLVHECVHFGGPERCYKSDQ